VEVAKACSPKSKKCVNISTHRHTHLSKLLTYPPSQSVLQLADEFIDNVITGACKLAKLRGQGSLELRDIQLVLEKQYNIRIPGYATDEVRTVRKAQPSAQYLQKMNAVSAAKLMGGKGEL